MQTYIWLGVGALVIAAIILAYWRGDKAGSNRERLKSTTAEADKRRRDDEIDQLPMSASEADDAARRLAAARGSGVRD